MRMSYETKLSSLERAKATRERKLTSRCMEQKQVSKHLKQNEEHLDTKGLSTKMSTLNSMHTNFYNESNL